jgi:hypothetical protein
MTARPRTVAIMQPTYLPYLGYFDLIQRADVFVFLDDVQFERRSWQSRNRILTAEGERMLSVPVRKHAQDTRIDAIETADETGWRAEHLTTIRHAYARRPGFAEGIAFLEETLVGGRLVDLHAGLIEQAARRLGLQTQFVRASTLGCGGKRSDHLLEICRATEAEEYLSPMGSADYIAADGAFAAASLPVRFNSFVEVAYDQGRPTFTPYLAFIDAVMNLGWDGTRAVLEAMRA